MTIFEAAVKTGLSVEVLEMYERVGLLPRRGTAPDGERSWSDDVIRRLPFISRLSKKLKGRGLCCRTSKGGMKDVDKRRCDKNGAER